MEWLKEIAVSLEKNRLGDVPNRKMVVFILLLGEMLIILDTTMIIIALPTIAEFFGLGSGPSQWIVTAYYVALPCLLLISGPISDMVGSRRMFLGGVLRSFFLRSLACSIATSIDMLILFRFIQGAGVAIAAPVIMAMIFQAYPAGEKTRDISGIASADHIRGVVGRVLGGLTVFALGWNYIFLINIAVGAALLILGFKYFKLDRKVLIVRDDALIDRCITTIYPKARANSGLGGDIIGNRAV